MLPDIAIGALGAALIGALISLVSLIVSKETKVSEFRQAWIDALRLEFSSYLSRVIAVADARNVTFEDEKQRFETLQPYYDTLNEAYYQIAFRLNPTEDKSKQIQICMVILSSMIQQAKYDLAEFENQKVTFIRVANLLLKEEWQIVKKGELVFRITKWVTGGVVAMLTLAVAVLIFNQSEHGGTKLRLGQSATQPSSSPSKNPTLPQPAPRSANQPATAPPITAP